MRYISDKQLPAALCFVLLHIFAWAAVADEGEHVAIVFLKQIQGPSPQDDVKQTASSATGRFFDQPYALETVVLGDAAAVRQAFRTAFKRGVREFIVDINADELLAIVDSEQGKQSWFYNLDTSKNRSRSKFCRRNVLNIVTGHAMRSDALLNAAVVYALRLRTLETRGNPCS